MGALIPKKEFHVMLRPVLFAAAAIALIAPARAAEPDLAGNWQLNYSARATTEQSFAIIKLEMNDGKATASTLYTSLKNVNVAISGIEINGKTIKFKSSYLNWTFEGILDADGKTAIGSFGNDQAPYRARLTRTGKTEVAPGESVIRATLPPEVDESQKLMTAVNALRFQAFQEKDADKKKELTEKANLAQKELDEKQPGLLREIVAKHADTLFALDAALDLLRAPMKFKVNLEEAKKLVAEVERKVTPYGTKYSRAISIQLLESLAYQKGLESAVVHLGEKLSKELTDKDTPAFQSGILSAYKTVLEASSLPGKDATLKSVTANLDKIEGKLDTEYLKTVPPFKPIAFTGRMDKNANQVVVMELFTGAQCPPCVAADVAFDALQKSYKPSELVLIQYHLHIPGPDPLTNAETVARAKYYGANSTPTTLFNGKKLAGGGGGMANAEGKFKQYSSIIEPLLEKSSDVKVTGKADRSGDKVNIAVEVAGAEGDEMKLRLLVVEETIKYVGGNTLRFHHQVVRAMPGGADGVAIKDKTFKHSASVDLVNVRKELTIYLDEFAKERPFPKPQRPMDMKSLRVIALVQNDKTKEIVQALQIDLEGTSTAGGGGE
jgi:hypothetical protein